MPAVIRALGSGAAAGFVPAGIGGTRMRNGSHTVVVTSQLFGTQTDAGLRLLREHGFRVLENAAGKYHTEEDVIARAAEAEAIVCDMEPITARVMDAAPRLRIIARRGVGTDAVDTAEAARRGIAVARTTGALENSVADLVMAFLLALARRLPELDREVKAGRWTRLQGEELAGKVLGIVGFGAIGLAVMKRARAFGMEVIYHSRSVHETGDPDVVRVELDELLARSDYVSVHVPLSPETRGMFGAKEFGKMKPGAVFINTARGAVVNEAELARALADGVIRAAASDVFEREPVKDSPLLAASNVILTPHVGSHTGDAAVAMDMTVAQNIIDFFDNGTYRA